MDTFSSWYFKHNNENDKNMCYIKIDLSHGFFYKDGTGYDVDFINKQATEFPFTFDIKTIDNYKWWMMNYEFRKKLSEFILNNKKEFP